MRRVTVNVVEMRPVITAENSKRGHGYAECLLYVDAQAVGQIGATTRDALSGIASPHTLRQTTAWPGGYANIYRDAFEAGYRRSSPNGRIRR